MSLERAASVLPAEVSPRLYRLVHTTLVSQAEAELLFAVSDAAVYFPDTAEVLSLEVEGPKPMPGDPNARISGTVGSAIPADMDTTAPRNRRSEVLGPASLSQFAPAVEQMMTTAAIPATARFMAKFPSVIKRPVDAGESVQTKQMPVTALDTNYTVYQNFEGDVWSYWSRGDNTGGQYTWAVSNCAAKSGYYSADAVMGGFLGSQLGCSANYPPQVKTWMYSQICQTIPVGWYAWASLYLTGTIGTGTDDYFAVYTPDSSNYLYGYSFIGTWSGWWKLVFNLRQWYQLGDLGANACNTAYLYFSSSANAPAGSGPHVDDFEIDVGPTAATWGQSQISASPSSGQAPLTVAFQAVTDLTLGVFSWNFGDGTTSTALNPVHTYTAAGTYSVMFKAAYSGVLSAANTTVTVQSAPSCSYTLAPTSASVAASGGSGSFTVNTAGGCTWTASSGAAWLHLTGGSSGTGTGSVSYSVDTNSGALRSGSIVAGGQVFTVNQAAAPPTCTSFGFAPTSASVGPAAGSQAVTLTGSPSGCQGGTWSASGNGSWITVSPTAGTGSGPVTVSWSQNTGTSPRSGYATIAGQAFTVSQSASSCSYALSPTSGSYPSSGGGGFFSLSTSSDCPWTASTAAAWLHVTTPSGSGSASVNFTLDANTGSQRTGTISVAGLNFTVNQSGPVPTSYTYWIPVASHGNGLNGSQWRSDLGLLNAGSFGANVQIMFFGSNVFTNSTSIPAGAQSILSDIVGQLGGSGSGPLEVVSDQALKITGRTYNQVASSAACYAAGTQGQDYPTVVSVAGLQAQQSAYLAGLSENAAYRCNIGLVNTGSAAASVLVELYGGNGTELASYKVSMPAGTWSQSTQPYLNLARQTAMGAGYAKVTVQSGSGVFAFASVIDNITNDPTTITMQQ